MNKKISIILILALLLSVNVIQAFASSFDVTDVSVATGIIDSGIGKITLTFNLPVDFTTISALDFSKADGSAVPGGVYVKEGEISTQAVVTFGRLPIGEYILTVGDEVKSSSGISATAATYNYEVVSSVPEKLLKSINFEGLTAGDKLYTDLNAAFSGASFYSSNGFSKYKVLDPETGPNTLEMWASAKNREAGIVVTLDEPVYAGDVYVDLKVKATEGYVNRNLFTVFDGLTDTQAVKTVEIHNKDTGIRKRPYGSTCTVSKAHPDKDTDGYYYLRFSISRPTSLDAWDVRCIDLNSENKDLVFAIDAPTSAVSFVQKFQICQLYTSYDNEVNEKMWVSDLKISKSVAPKLLYIDEVISPDADTFDVVITEDVSDVSAELLLDSEQIAVKSELLPDKRTLRITPENYLAAGKEYTVRFGGMAVADTTVRTDAPSASVSGLAVLQNTLTGTVSFNNASGKSYLMLAVGFTSDGKPIGIAETVVTDSVSNPVSIDVSELGSATTFKIYLWEQDTFSMIPLCSPHEVVR